MLIHGKDRRFLLTIGASSELSELCPNGDIAKLGDLMTKATYAENLRIIVKLAVAMNKGFELNRKYGNEGYEPDVITEEELMSLTPAELKDLQEAVIRAFAGDIAPQIELEPEKKRNAVTTPEA